MSGRSRLIKTLCVFGACVPLAQIAPAQVAIKAKIIHTMAGAPIRDGVIVARDGKIVAVGPASTTPIPEGLRMIEAEVVTPGLIDARCTVGVSGLLNQRQDQDQLERSSPIQPELRAVDAYNPLDPLVEYVRSFGVTTIQTGHAPGELVSGQLAIFKTSGNSVEEALVVPESALAATLGPGAQKGGGSPGTRAKMVAMLREQLLKAQKHAREMEKHAEPATDTKITPPDEEKPTSESPDAASSASDGAKADASQRKDAPARDLRMEALVRVLKKQTPLVMTANRVQDIQSALRLAEEFDLRVILDSACEAPLMLDEVKEAGVDVILHPTMARAYGEMENKSYESALLLRRAGIRVAIQGGYEDYVPKARVVLFEAAVAHASGLSEDDALRCVTIDAAKILGVEARVGSIEAGKDADFAFFDAPPLQYTSHCTGVVINGNVVSELTR
jgi:imidazolonepropionase-like amidohydrolase